MRNIAIAMQNGSPRCGAYSSDPFQVPRFGDLHPVLYLLTTGDQSDRRGVRKTLPFRLSIGYGSVSPKNCFKGGQDELSD